MKFTTGQPVIVLNSEYKPAESAIIKIFNPYSKKSACKKKQQILKR